MAVFPLINGVFRKIPKLVAHVTWRFSSSFSWRTHTCGELGRKNIGTNVVLCGWLQYKRINKFLILRDSYGVTQVYVSDKLQREKNVDSLHLESVLKVTGVVRERPRDQYNKNMKTGEIEIEAFDLQLLNPSKPTLPFNIREFHQVKEPLRLQHRYLDLRNKALQENLRLRSRFVLRMREFLCKVHNFVEVETPTLFRKTPGGAREFVVPSRFPGKFYVLTQSPQQFKQLLMVGAIDRYFQIARCYRDESTLSDRQPEFTQLDLEMSFASPEHIRAIIEEMLYNAWPEEKRAIETPFPLMRHADAMQIYGTDKPDTRYQIHLTNVTDILQNRGVNLFDDHLGDGKSSIQAIVIPQGSTRMATVKPVLEMYRNLATMFHVPGLIDVRLQSENQWKSMLNKFLCAEVQSELNNRINAESGDLIIISCGQTKNVLKFLGKIRTEIAYALQSKYGDIFNSEVLNFIWIVDFPLFEESDSGQIESAHHPFTAPHTEDIPHLFVDPLNVQGLHYDLVLNGQEIGGGSIRIHDSMLQQRILKEILKEDVHALEHLLDALECGCPPHGGIALGLDRLVSIMCNCNGIREVIAFPKSFDGKDLMSGAPTDISDEDKAIYHIKSTPET